jgi:peptidyl-prolyl cis-trans isomerase SurA
VVELNAMRLRKVLPVAGVAAAVALVVLVRPARATVVERVVAVVGERSVLWSDLLRRATGPRLQIRQQTQDPNVVNVQEQVMYEELLDRMIDDRLEEQQAEKAHINATPEEIDRGIANIAAQAQAAQGQTVTADDVIAEMRRRGFQETDFRDEIRRQIIEGKLVELRVRPRVRVTEQDAQEQYKRTTEQMKKDTVNLQMLALRVPRGSTNTQLQQLMQRIQQQANSGTSFSQLVKQYCNNASTGATCGSPEPKRVTELLKPIQDAVHKLAPGQVSDPLLIQAGDDQVILLVSWVPPAIPPYESVKNEMLQRALGEGLERERKRWLWELRHSVYIDVRL